MRRIADHQKSAFTLIELMIAVMIMALLVTGAALTFARPIQAARWGEARAIGTTTTTATMS